ncbi:MAG: hypothetical protein UU85_C0004G0100 [Candidatus Wolfebacteria bacterium GW2011_GWA2_42_10]|uniref:Uncharacterized protein n=2 Tax=Candidatus Wolfeibacteriota TaxID=1752735 RepID=A0A0G0ZTL7_9BACT|nr:MAG: hypothetical protein UU38_C0001G0161 [Candidatus Wolfebacteria bacterium GW2011_GWB1_41_12]KKS25341.1 MAG: hypothetical protein UU85_C0004G0100 [Candidatus Wolfebacteria bacterium GW2011_GWA2_42_10]KKT56780.1 MAG: hypothetical protein UW50_C0001G0349 [Candidatus Wolfebacteria bacterium GW2011_GWA1_44_24]
MARFKIAATVLVLGAGLIGSYLIVKNSASQADVRQEALKKIISEVVSENPIKWLEQNAASLTGSGAESGKTAQASKAIANFNSFNLTEFVAQSLFGQMKNLDQSGQNPFENFDIDDPQNQKLIQEAIAGIQDPSLIFSAAIDDKDLKISNDNSVDAKSRYLNNLADIVVKDDPLKKTGGIVGSLNFLELKEVADNYQGIINEFINVSVPSDWSEYHKRFISILKKQEIIYRGIVNYQDDPMKAGLFIQLAPEIIGEETTVRKEFFENYLGLNS